jgi:peptidoglycan/LPS O-acetylase OafA/YrhL
LKGAAHRDDIDGLRALAVLPVVAYHAGIHAIRGGFVGVDIFLVISGYLITEILIRDIRNERFSIVAFYERRIRRIFPALLAMLLVTFVLGVWYCLPQELVNLSKSELAAALSVSNVYFWLQSGYFDGTALTKPLLHTWSLAVEEQFYLFWPVLLLIGHRYFRRHLLPAIAALAALSLGISIVGAFRFPNATFYLPFTRTWELAAGGLLSLPLAHPRLGRAAREALSIIGAALILASILLIDADMPFPGLLALPPCLGAVFIIAAGRDGTSLVGLVLSLKPLTFIGLISYSLYLWHWPIIVFQRNDTFLISGLSERYDKVLVILVAAVVATLSWRYIEQPFRSGRLRPSDARLVKLAAGGVFAIVLAAVVGWTSQGFPARFTAEELSIASYLKYDADGPWRVGKCFLSGRSAAAVIAPECLTPMPGEKNVLLLGDSHAAQMWSGLNAAYPGINFLEATASDCFPTVRHSLGEAPKCSAIMDRVYGEFLTTHRVDRVLLAARWKAGLLDNVDATLDWFNAHHIAVTLAGPSAIFDSPVPRLLISALRHDDPASVQNHMDASIRTLDDAMAQLAARHGVEYLSMLDLYCAGAACRLTDARGMPIIFDQEHWTADSSRHFAEQLHAMLN